MRTVFAVEGSELAFKPDTWEGLAQTAVFDCQALARLCLVSTRTLNRFFRRNRGQTAQDWMNELRLSSAWHRLGSAESVKEVAIDLGFGHASNFTRSFRTRFGMTPHARLTAARIEQKRELAVLVC